MKPCLIIGASPAAEAMLSETIRSEAYYVICADGGLDLAHRMNIVPDLVIGDFDSVTTPPEGDWKTIALPREKDDTDLLAAVKEGFAAGCREFRILGALGARLDHAYGNLSVLLYIANHGGIGVLEDSQTKVRLVRAGDAPLVLQKQIGETVSVFPFGAAQCTVTYQGLQYPLKHGILSIDTPLGVSNVICEATASINVEKGMAVVMIVKV